MHTTGGTTARAAAIRALLHPLSLAAIVVLIVNDFVLKSAWPGVVTGKLSDFAGLVFFPLLLAIPLGRLIRSQTATIALAVGITGAWFTATKVSSVAAEATESLVEFVLNGSTIVVDPTDLVALVSLLGAYGLYRGAMTDADTPRFAATTRASLGYRRAVTISVIAVAAVATIASTVANEYLGFTDIAIDGDRVFAGEGEEHEDPLRYSYMSNDGGMNWERVSDARASSVQRFTRSQELGPVCLPGEPDTCFRIGGSAIVQESTDGGQSWEVGWSLPESRALFLSRYGSSSDPYDVKGWDIVLVGPSGSTLLVAMGDDGVLRRTVDGTWTRDVLGTAEPLAERGANIFPEIIAILALTTFALAGAVLRARRLVDLQRPIGRLVSTGLAVLPATLALATLAWTASDESGGFGLVFIFVGPASAWIGLAAVAALWSMIIEQDRHAGRKLLIRSSAAILVAAFTAFFAFYAWSAGWIQDWSMTLALALGAATVTLGIGWRSMTTVEPNSDVLDEPPLHEGGLTPTDNPPSLWKSRPSLRRWAAAVLLTLSSPFLFFGIFMVVAVVPGYLASLWTQHRRPLARTMAAVGAGITTMVFSALTGGGYYLAGWSNLLLLSAGTWVVVLMVLRAPNRTAVWARGGLIAGVVLVAPILGSAIGVVAFTMPLLIVGVDSLTIRAGYGQFESDEVPVPGVPLHKDVHPSPQSGEE